MISDHVVELCHRSDTVSSIYAKDTTQAPSDILKKLFGHETRDRKTDVAECRQPASAESQAAALRCGRWGPTKPSPLFLQAFADSLQCLDADPLSGVVSPPLMGSHGTMPLTIIAPLADIIRHCANLIARARKDVFFITCSWSASVAQRLIRNALFELSTRAGERGERVSVKIMYDRAGPSNVFNSHQRMKPETYSSKAIGLPKPEEVPNLDLDVTSLHVVPLGTLHAKFCVVDGKIAAVMSNNMEDNDNMEMMVHVEGPIVDSIYDTALITWNKSVDTPLPPDSQEGSAPATESNGSKPTTKKATTDDEPLYLERRRSLNHAELAAAGEAEPNLPSHTPEDPHYDDDIEGEMLRVQSCYSTKPHESRLQAANRLLNVSAKNPVPPTGPEVADGEEMTPYMSTSIETAVPMAMVSRPPYGWVDSKNGFVPQNEAWLSLIRNATESIFIQTPDLNAAPLIPALVEALKRGVQVTYYVCFGYNDHGEMIPGQGGTNDQVSMALVNSLPQDGPERELLHIYNYVGKDQDHPIHQSFHSRSCHIKLLIVDGSVGIQGSGNQDTQSWFHSQEVNVMVDSKEICGLWREGIDRNQNTKAFGRVAKDGLWRDADGKPGDGYLGDPGKVDGLFKGIAGMIKKMEGGMGG